MPYNNSPYYSPYYNQIVPQNNGRIWVQGESGAKSYIVAPNQTVELWDSENHTIYLKSADANGIPNIQILDYTVRTPVQTHVTETVSKKDLTNIFEQINTLKVEIDMLKSKLGSGYIVSTPTTATSEQPE